MHKTDIGSMAIYQSMFNFQGPYSVIKKAFYQFFKSQTNNQDLYRMFCCEIDRVNLKQKKIVN